MASRYRLIPAFLFLHAACPGDKGADGSSGGDSTAGTTEADPTESASPGCACVDPEQFGSASYICEIGPCDSVDVVCSSEAAGSDPVCGSSALVSLDEEALNCALDQLIARTPGTISTGENDTTSSSSAFIEVSDAAKVLTRRSSLVDLGGQQSAAGFVTLKDPAYFMGCKAETDVQARYICFREWSDEEPAADCDEPEELSNQY
jgi:hypothetical protein